MTKKPIGLFDIPVQFACPDCGNGIQVKLARLEQRPLDIICASCAHQINLSDEQTARLVSEHGKKLSALRGTLSKR